MQYEVMEIKLSDILFNENNPRVDMGDLDTLAASFVDGEPYTPPIVARDGRKYRLFDGERRVRAMQQLGTKRCHVNVYPSFVAAEAAIASMATNLKKSLDREEQAKGFQTMLEYDVSDEDMRRATGMEIERVRTVRRVLKGAGAVQTDMDAIFEADQFEDPAERQKVLEAGRQAHWVAQSIKREHSLAKQRTKLHAAIARCGVPEGHISDEPSSDYELSESMGLAFLGYVTAPRDASDLLDGYTTDKVFAWLSDRSYEVAYCVYADAAEEAKKPGEAHKRRMKQALERLRDWVSEGRKSAITWYVAAWERESAKLTALNTAVCNSRRKLADVDEHIADMVAVSTPSMHEVCQWISVAITPERFRSDYQTGDIKISCWNGENAGTAWSLLLDMGWTPPEGTPVDMAEALDHEEELGRLVETITGELQE